jgi:hypothetical protein
VTTSQAGRGRLDRLAGNGSGEAGIDLASLFRVILNQTQDSTGGVDFDEFIEPVQAAVSNHARVEHWYGQFATTHGPWKALIADALDQLQSRDLLAWGGDGWVLGPAFATGKRLVVVPARSRKNKSVGVILYPADERAARGEAEKRRMEVTSLASSLRESGSGLRPLTAEHVETLAQSMRDFGYRPEFPILVDQHERILDGRHRQAAARKAGIPEPIPSRKVTVSSDEEAVGLAILVNIQRGWTQAERKRIDRDLQAAGLTMEGFGRALGTAAKRELVKAALLENPDLSHKKIADGLGVAHSFVGNVCAEVVSESTSECRHGLTGQGARTDRQAPSELTERAEEALRADPMRSNKQIQADLGLPENTHRPVEQARRRLEERGEIPRTSARVGSDGVVRHKPRAATPAEPAAGSDARVPASDVPSWEMMAELFRRLPATDKASFLAAIGAVALESER